MTLPPLPNDRDWSEATWRAGLDEAVRLIGDTKIKTWDDLAGGVSGQWASVKAHATTLLDAGIVKPVVSEAEAVWKQAFRKYVECGKPSDAAMPAIAVIQSALDKARTGQ